MTQQLVATTSFWTQHDGEDKLFLAGISKLPADHPIVKRAAAYFEPPETEPAPAKPPPARRPA